MSYTTIFCEGENDTFFLHEIISKKLINEVEIIEDTVQFERKFRSFYFKKISIIKGIGYPGYIETAIHYLRQLSYQSKINLIGIFGDGDRAKIYDKFLKDLNIYIQNEWGKHNVNPIIEADNQAKIIKISFKKDKSKKIWTFEVPENLEKRISEKLREDNPKLKEHSDPHDEIKVEAERLGISKEVLIRQMVRKFCNDSWFINLIKTLKSNLSS